MTSPDGRPVAAVRGLVATLLALIRREQATHIAVAFDHVIESFRNDLFPGYKTGAGVPEELRAQFGLAEDATTALGIVTWPMTEFEADDAIATAAMRWWDAPQVDQVVICSPDKDMMQLTRADRIISLDRRKNIVYDEPAVVEKFGVAPTSIPDYLALVGDAADGIPGVPRWGAKSTPLVLARYQHIDSIPPEATEWEIQPQGAKGMAANLAELRDNAALYKRLATLRTDVPLTESLADLEWRGAKRQEYTDLCDALGFGQLRDAPHRWLDGS